VEQASHPSPPFVRVRCHDRHHRWRHPARSCPDGGSPRPPRSPQAQRRSVGCRGSSPLAARRPAMERRPSATDRSRAPCLLPPLRPRQVGVVRFRRRSAHRRSPSQQVLPLLKRSIKSSCRARASQNIWPDLSAAAAISRCWPPPTWSSRPAAGLPCWRQPTGSCRYAPISGVRSGAMPSSPTSRRHRHDVGARSRCGAHPGSRLRHASGSPPGH